MAPFRDPVRVHAMCEDYRAGAYADYDIDKADHEAGKKITIPMLALWGDVGIAQRRGNAARYLEEWATNVDGHRRWIPAISSPRKIRTSPRRRCASFSAGGLTPLA